MAFLADDKLGDRLSKNQATSMAQTGDSPVLVAQKRDGGECRYEPDMQFFIGCSEAGALSRAEEHKNLHGIETSVIVPFSFSQSFAFRFSHTSPRNRRRLVAEGFF
jgi:hypothetical protein